MSITIPWVAIVVAWLGCGYLAYVLDLRYFYSRWKDAQKGFGRRLALHVVQLLTGPIALAGMCLFLFSVEGWHHVTRPMKAIHMQRCADEATQKLTGEYGVSVNEMLQRAMQQYGMQQPQTPQQVKKGP